MLASAPPPGSHPAHVYMIIAHAAPAHLASLVTAIADGAAAIVIHIDRKSAIEPFRDAVRNEKAHFTHERVSVHWAGWSQVAATLILLEAARERAPDARFFTLLSGGDYPVASNRAIAERLSGLQGDAIDAAPLPIGPEDPGSIRIRKRYLEGGLRAAGPARLVIGGLNRLLRLLPDRRIPEVFRAGGFMTGSQWWTLRREAVDHVLAFRERHPAAHAFFRHVMTPDEIYFQTVLATWPGWAPATGSFTFADWTGSRGSPQEIAPDHIEQLAAAAYPRSKLFARKFSARNAALLPVIDRRLREVEGAAPAA